MVRPERVKVVLVRPARPANVAAAARALKNMGLSRLVLVEPPAGLSAPEARALAYGAWDVLDGALCAESLAAAVADCAFVAGASSRGGAAAWTPRQLAERAEGRAGGGGLALVFGPEASGLTTAELRLCHELVTIPADPAQPSLNLAQAVLVLAYELRATRGSGAAAAAGEPRASAGELESALGALREGLRAVGYLSPDNPDAILAELRRLLGRAGPTPRELNLLRGIARQVAWAGSEAARARSRREGA